MSNFYNNGIFSVYTPHGAYGGSSVPSSSRQASCSWGCRETACANCGPGWTSIVGSHVPTFEGGLRGIVGYSPSFPSNSCYNTDKTEKRESGDNMSFVGMRVCSDGIVAWGDSKSSREDVFGNAYFDKKRGIIQKVFKNEKGKYLISTFGANTIEAETKNNEIYMEDWLRENVEKHESVYQLIEDFTYYARYELHCLSEYHFIIGCKDEHAYYVQGIDIKGESVIFSLKYYKLGAYLRTNNIYGLIFDNMKYASDLTCSDFAERQEKWLIGQIKTMDANCAYNPVGGPIRLETLLFDK